MCIFLLEIILKFVAYGLQAPSLGGVKLSHAVSSIYLPISILNIDIYGHFGFIWPGYTTRKKSLAT